MPVGGQNDTDPIQRQCNLESLEENKILNAGCALRQSFVMLNNHMSRRGHAPAFPHFPTAERSR
jgi:hypothetical protein